MPFCWLSLPQISGVSSTPSYQPSSRGSDPQLLSPELLPSSPHQHFLLQPGLSPTHFLCCSRNTQFINSSMTSHCPPAKSNFFSLALPDSLVSLARLTSLLLFLSSTNNFWVPILGYYWVILSANGRVTRCKTLALQQQTPQELSFPMSPPQQTAYSFQTR